MRGIGMCVCAYRYEKRGEHWSFDVADFVGLCARRVMMSMDIGFM